MHTPLVLYQGPRWGRKPGRIYMSVPIENLLITKDDLYMMGEGRWYRSYEKQSDLQKIL